MFFAEYEWSRLILILVVQLFLSILYSFISAKILLRNKNRLTLTLSCFYIFNAIGFLINAIYLLFNVNPIVYILVFITAYTVLFGYIFIVIFMLNLIKFNISLNNLLLVIASYAILLFFTLMIPKGIIVNESTNWRPIYSWSLVIIVSILFSCFIFIPTALLTKKALKIFQDPKLKSKSRYFFLGIFLIELLSYGGLFNIALNNSVIRDIWAIVVLLVIPAGIMIYYGIAHKL